MLWLNLKFIFGWGSQPNNKNSIPPKCLEHEISQMLRL
jgi:hypothetical protein